MDTNQTGRQNENVNKQRPQTPSTPQKEGQTSERNKDQSRDFSRDQSSQDFSKSSSRTSEQDMSASRPQGQDFNKSRQKMGNRSDSSQRTQPEFQQRLRQQWPNFSDDDISEIDEDNALLSGRLEKVYGYSKDRAEREYRNFMSPGQSSSDAIH